MDLNHRPLACEAIRAQAPDLRKRINVLVRPSTGVTRSPGFHTLCRVLCCLFAASAHCERCGRRVHWVPGDGCSLGHWAHAEACSDGSFACSLKATRPVRAEMVARD